MGAGPFAVTRRCYKKWMAARKKYFSTKHLHSEWRKDFQHSLIDALAKTEHLPRETIKKRMKREESQRVLGQKARRIRGKGIKTPVFKAVTTDENGETIEFNTQSSMVPIIAESNRFRQQQCSGTPFMTPPLVEIFGHLASNIAANQVKNGTFIPPAGNDSVIVDLFELLKMPKVLKEKKEVSLIVTPEENAAVWKKMKDKTASAFGTPGFASGK